MDIAFLTHLENEMKMLKAHSLFKQERVITSPQNGTIELNDHRKVLNFCANNYLGLANHPQLIGAAEKSLEKYGFGLASVRFICGTQDIHIQLEKKISEFLQTDETILYSSCFDANGGFFETVLGQEDAIISDSLNHASIIDGIRLSKAKRFRYQNNDMQDLEKQLHESRNCRFRIIVTDGVFSMDGSIANLSAICDLADKYSTLVMVDDCHAAGFLGKNGRGSIEYCNVMGRVDVVTGTLGKALGGASGGYTSGRKEIVSWLRQRSRPYLFSNTLCPNIVSATLEVFNILQREGPQLREKLHKNSQHFRQQMTKLGFKLLGMDHPIIPVLLNEAHLAQAFATKMLEKGVYVVGFFYPVVPQGLARIRTQMSAAHSRDDLDRAISAFHETGKELGVI